MRGPDRRHAALLALLAVGVHLPSLSNGFAWDDPAHVVANESLHGLGRLGEVVTSPYLRDTHPMRSPYRPWTSASYAVSWAMGGGDPFAFHLFNVAAHAAATVLVLALLTALGAPAAAAGAATALFAVHPVHVEAVANVVGRGDVLATLGVLAAAVAWVRRDLAARVRAPTVLLGCALALGAKESGVVVVALLLLLRALPPEGGGPERGGKGGALRADAPLLAGAALLTGAYLLARRAVLGTWTTVDVAPYIAALPDPLRLSTAVANLSEVARLLLFPRDLVADYAPGVIHPAGWADLRFAAGAAVALGALVLAGVSAVRGRRWVALGVAWVALALLPVSNLVVEVPVWVAERTLYLPSVGISLAAVGGWLALRERAGEPARRTAAGLVLLLVVLGGARSWSRASTWESTDTVMATLVEEHPESYRARWWLARELLGAGLEERALARYEEAVAINPNDAFVTLDYARALILAGHPSRAEALVRPIPPGLDPSRSVYLAQALLEQGRADEALEVVEEGLRRWPAEARLLGQRERLLEEVGTAGYLVPGPVAQSGEQRTFNP